MQQIGRYEIRSEIGRGGMATVYRAFDPDFKREVALKLLPREFVHDQQFRQRFQLEAQTIASLEHPNIVPVYEYSAAGDDIYLVMRLMPGGSLADRLQAGPLSVAEAARILEKLAPALDLAHAKGFVHRDLKPGNILFDQSGEPYLTDFGIVKLVEGNSASLTVTGGLLGTPAYMSPEQVRGEPLDGRSDIYALGAVFYEMLTGKQPYRATTPIGQAFKHVNEPVPRILDDRADLPPYCQEIIDTAMAKEPAARFGTAAQMSAALSAHLAGRPLPPTAVETRPPQTGRGSKVPAWAWIVLAAVFVLALALILMQVNRRNNRLASAATRRAATAATASALVVAPPTAETPLAATALAASNALASATAFVTNTAVPTLAPTDEPAASATPEAASPTATPMRSSVTANRPNERNWDSFDSIWQKTSPLFQDMQSPGVQTYTAGITPGEVFRWSFRWCAADAPTLIDIMRPLSVSMEIDGEPLAADEILAHNEPLANGWPCRYMTTILNDWEAGTAVRLEINYRLSSAINDGEADYAAGIYRQIIEVNVGS